MGGAGSLIMWTRYRFLRFIWLLTWAKAFVTVSSGVSGCVPGKKRWENAEVNCERQRAAPLKSTYLKCYSERRLVSNLPENTSRCKGSLMSFSHCVLPHLKIIRNQLPGCTLAAPARRLRWQITGVTGIQPSTLKLLWIHHPGNCSTLLFTVADTRAVMHGGASGRGGGTHTHMHIHTSSFFYLASTVKPRRNPQTGLWRDQPKWPRVAKMSFCFVFFFKRCW